MPKFLEKKLKKQYGPDSPIPYKIMNAKGLMRGNKETKKGKDMEQKHTADMGLRHASSYRSTATAGE
jgi:hypothetical protein